MERESQYLLRNKQTCREIHNFLVNSQVFERLQIISPINTKSEDLQSLTLMIS